MDAPHVVVIGGGLAGLAAAFRLRRHGFSATLVERDAAPGGRARSGTADGIAFDDGAQVLGLEASPRFYSLAREAGAAEALLPLRPLTSLRFADGRPQPVSAWRSRDAGRLLDRLRLARLERVEGRFRSLLARRDSERGERLDDRSVAELAALYLPRMALEGWVAPLAASLGLGDPASASRIALMRLHAAGALAPALPRAPLGVLADVLAKAVDARLGCAAERVEPGGRGLSVALAAGGALEADAVVVATPAQAALAVAEPLLTPPEREFLAAATTAPALVLQAALERGLEDGPSRIGLAASAGLPVAALLHEPGDATSSRVPAGRAAASLVAAPDWSRARLDAPDDVLGKELLALLDRVRPGASRLVCGVRVVRHAAAYPLFPVGRYRALARLRRVQADRRALGRRLYLAGDHLAGPTLDDAILSGLRAASELATDFRKGVRP